ncbi:hypothetical protein [Chitinophaga sp.]|uniref:hypothetical protein n=1 Tax=Chitinophaga sp. TaxID=1869181 RepID=UPI0031D840DD
MRRILLLTLLTGLLAACNNKPKQVNDEDRVLTFEDFRNFFPAGGKSYRLNADSLRRSQPDSLALKARVVKQFLPDTLAKGVFTAAEKPRFFPRVLIEREDMLYFVVEGRAKKGSAAWLSLYDKNGAFLQRHLVAQNISGKPRTGFLLDDKFNIRVTTELQRGTRDDVYAANPDGSLVLILTNSSEPVNAGLYNPIDTLPRKHKYSANYGTGEHSLVAIRDGETSKEFQFFIHFSKDNGACTGELDGVGRFTSANTGQFRDKRTSCILEFKFSSSRVTISETGCGAYRGIKCFFEGSYTKKREKKK